MGERNVIRKGKPVASCLYFHDLEWAREALHKQLDSDVDWYPNFHVLDEDITQALDFFELFKFTDWRVTESTASAFTDYEGRTPTTVEFAENVTTVFVEDLELWEALAPALEAGSWIEFLGEDGYFRWVVKENKLFEERPHRIYPAYGLPDQKFAMEALVTLYEVYFKKSILALQSSYTDSIASVLVPSWFFNAANLLQEGLKVPNRPQLLGLPLRLHSKGVTVIGVELKNGEERWAGRP